jgi:NAD(P)-dependent dehydrogenase (short-subunit alcohol dehydrogenase family)
MTQAASTLLVTGASRGIGAATALLAAQRGWDIAVNYSQSTAAAEALAAQVRALGRRAIIVRADVADEAAVRAMFARIDAEMPPLKGLVNNAGIVGMKARLDDMAPARWRHLLEVNVFGSLLCAQLALLRMSKRHGGQGGAIVNLSSMAATLGSPAMYVDYAATKGAIDSFTIGLARELAAEGVRVNAIRPGIIATDIHADSGEPDRAQTSAGMIPMKRPGTAAEVANAIVWLLSDEASYTTGTIIDVSGGR